MYSALAWSPSLQIQVEYSNNTQLHGREVYANITYHTPKINIQRVGILALFPVMIEDNSDQTSNLVSYRLIFKLSSISTGNKRYYEISKYGCNQPNNVREHQVCNTNLLLTILPRFTYYTKS